MIYRPIGVSRGAIVIARAGSKRLENKNSLVVAGMRLVDRAVMNLTVAKYDTIVLYTDNRWTLARYQQDPDVIAIHRPPETATDTATTDDALRVFFDTDGRDMLHEHDTWTLLQPTSPQTRPEWLLHAHAAMMDRGFQGIVSVNPDYKPNGCFYMFRPSAWERDQSVYVRGMGVYVTPWVVDIDYRHDLLIAASVMNNNIVISEKP